MSLGSSGIPVEEQIRRRARETPDAVALIDEDRRLSYAQLDELTDALATRMRELGVGAERVVAAFVHRKLEAAVTLVAVLKAGGVYLPLEAGAPVERKALMLADSDAALLVVGSGVDADGFDTEKLHWAEPEDVPRAAAPEPNGARPGNAAYVLYTSGTTGRPKGVVIARDMLAAQLRAITVGFGLRREDRILQFSPMHVDTAIEQALSALTLGATLVVSDETLSVSGMLEFLERHRVTVAHLATGYWHAIANSLEWRDWPELPLRHMIVGGDRMSVKAAALWQRKAGIPLTNAYGPTETVITPTISPVTAIHEQLGAPLGAPIGDRTAYILDENFKECDSGVAGELHLGGAMLARGYLGRPGLSARSFVADPFSDVPGARLYRTGDIVRRMPDGELYFIGRKDSQLKFRGYRVELGEIDSVLASHPAVREIAVVAREDSPGNPRLVAYTVLRQDTVTLAELRAHAASRLPAHMVPTVFSILDALPLTSNSKVDRRALRGEAFRPTDTRRK
ncbi:amino acid adenylation domain-containing protein [Streptomyces sp. NPDC004546]|uniref:amino acid adenylation domain-containing protein n=1 Tax=Streptomyces sp. NPDC004546 TaxID=3154282 RepID=UPI0033BBED30